MKLDQRQKSFLQKRRKLLKLWPYVGPLKLLGVLGLMFYLMMYSPLLTNPLEVSARIQAGSLAQSTLEMMAMLLPIMFITTCFTLVTLIVLMYASFSNEKKYIKMIDTLEGD